MRKLLAFVFCLLSLAGLAAAQTPPGAALSSGYLSVQGNQFVDSSGNKMRIASTSYRGTPTDQTTMNAIRQAGFNAIRIDWRDGYLSAGGAGTPTFDDEFTSAPWLTHATWQSGDMWSFAGTAFPGGTGQGPTWWANPNDTPAAASVYTDSGTALNLSLITNPANSGLSSTACQGNPCTTIGALINNQLTPGGLTQLFGDYQFSVAVPATPGFLFQWDIECQPAGCSDGSMEYDVGIWTDSGNVQHVQFSNQCCGGNTIYFATTSIDITKQHVYEVNWQTDNTTFYIDDAQQFQTPTPSGSFQTAVALSYFLTSDATYFGYASSGPSAANLPATATLDWYRIYQKKPSGTAPVGCNTLAQMDQCVALAAAATPQPLKVIFSHRGNEIPNSPSNACNARQANGLWFDSGGSSGNDDGCGDGGNVTYAQFKANTAALMQRYAGNSTVIGYDFHAEPLVNGSFTGTGGGGGTGGFTAQNGQIFDPNGVAWVARGVNVTIEDACGTNVQGACSVSNSQVPLATLQRLFPRVNYVRVSNFLEGGFTEIECVGSNCFPGPTPENLAAWVKTLTDVGIRVEFSDYAGNTGNGCRSSFTNRYQQVAAFYAPGSTSGFGTPFVTFESQNECFGPGAAIDNWQANVSNNYNAVRSSNPEAQFTIGTAGGNFTSTYEFSSQFLAPFSNVIIDAHAYAGNPSWCNGCSQSATDSAAAGFVSAFKSQSTNTETNIPVISGEYGDAANPGAGIDPDGIKAVTSIYHIMSTGGGTTTSNGAAFWLWICGQPFPSTCTSGNQGDQLTTGGPNASIFNDSENYGSVSQSLIAAAPGAGPTPAGGGTGTNPPVNWGGGGDTDIMAACNDVGAAVFAVNPGVIQFCEGPLNNGANNLLSGAAKP